MILIPYEVDVGMDRWPISNFVLLGVIAVCFGLQSTLSEDTLFSMVLMEEQPWGLLGHMWLHGGLFHLLGNLLFLWVFGNAIAAKLGNVFYPFVYVALGVAAGLAHLFLDGYPAIGASGAINGVVGMFLVFYPRNDCSCLFIFWWRVRTFSVSSYWMILL